MHSGIWHTSLAAHPHVVNLGYSCTPSCRLIDKRFPSVIQKTFWLLYFGGFDWGCRPSRRRFFLFFFFFFYFWFLIFDFWFFDFLITHIYSAGWIQFWWFPYLLGSMSHPNTYDCFCLCPITRIIGYLSCFLLSPFEVSACLYALYWLWTYCAQFLVWPCFVHYMSAKSEQPVSFLIRAWCITEQTQPSVQGGRKGNPMHCRSCLCAVPILLTVGHLRLLVSPCSIEKTEGVDENYCLWC